MELRKYPSRVTISNLLVYEPKICFQMRKYINIFLFRFVVLLGFQNNNHFYLPHGQIVWISHSVIVVEDNRATWKQDHLLSQ